MDLKFIWCYECSHFFVIPFSLKSWIENDKKSLITLHLVYHIFTIHANLEAIVKFTYILLPTEYVEHTVIFFFTLELQWWWFQLNPVCVILFFCGKVMIYNHTYIKYAVGNNDVYEIQRTAQI